MDELENTMVPRLSDHLYFWGRYADDTFPFVKEESVTFVLEKLNSYFPNLQSTYELEKLGKLSFLDVLIIRQSNNKFETTVYRQYKNADICLNWLFTYAKYSKKGDIGSVDKSRLYIMLNRLPSKRRVALPVKSICRKE